MYIKNQQGYLLMEVVLAILIITVALITIAGMYTQSLRANANAGNYTIATNIAQQQMEVVKRDIEEQRNSIANWSNNSVYPVTINTAVTDLPNGTIKTAASLYDSNNPASKIIVITVTADWQDKTGSYTVAMTTYGLRNTAFSTFPRN